MTMHVQSCTRRLINVVAFKQLNYYFMVNFIFFLNVLCLVKFQCAMKISTTMLYFVEFQEDA